MGEPITNELLLRAVGNKALSLQKIIEIVHGLEMLIANPASKDEFEELTGEPYEELSDAIYELFDGIPIVSPDLEYAADQLMSLLEQGGFDRAREALMFGDVTAFFAMSEGLASSASYAKSLVEDFGADHVQPEQLEELSKFMSSRGVFRPPTSFTKEESVYLKMQTGIGSKDA